MVQSASGRVRKVSGASPTSLVTAWFGVTLVEGPTRRVFAFPKDPVALAGRLAALRRGEILEEERQARSAAGGPVKVHEARLRELGEPVQAVPPAVEVPAGFDRLLLHRASLELARVEAREAFSARDRVVVQKVKSVDEIVRTANLLSERLREWYALHAPELVRAIAEPETLARAVAEHGGREAVAKALDLEDLTLIGTDPTPEDIESVRTLAGTLVSLYDDWRRLEEEVDREMGTLAPNLRALLGGLLAARLVAQAGSLQRLAALPASTVQTLGAEGALFRHLREGAPPPKHGLVFQFEAVNRAPPWLRGPIARTLAAKIAVAARTDAFGSTPDGSAGRRLAEALAVRVEKLRAARPNAPPRAPRGGKRPRRGGRR